MFVFEPLNGSYMGTNDSLITKEIEREGGERVRVRERERERERELQRPLFDKKKIIQH